MLGYKGVFEYNHIGISIRKRIMESLENERKDKLMTEQEKLMRAKEYADKLANGIDPISNTEMPSDTVLNNVRLARYFFYLSGILGELILGEKKHSGNKKLPFAITRVQIEQIELSSTPIPISHLAKRINAVIDEGRKKFSYRWANEWLIDAGFLDVNEETGKKFPTEAGGTLGIFQEERTTSNSGSFMVTLYRKEAQQFLLDNLDAMLAKQSLYVS